MRYWRQAEAYAEGMDKPTEDRTNKSAIRAKEDGNGNIIVRTF